MKGSTIKRMGVLSSLVFSLFLLTATVNTNNAQASTVNYNSLNGVQLAWWGGGYYGPRYRHGYYRPGYYNSYYRPYYRNACKRVCWRNKWGNLRCKTRCY